MKRLSAVLAVLLSAGTARAQVGFWAEGIDVFPQAPRYLAVGGGTLTGLLAVDRADTTVHICLGPSTASDVGLIPDDGAIPALRFKACTATSWTSNVADASLYMAFLHITDADNSGNSRITLRRADGITMSGPFAPTNGTLTGAQSLFPRRGIIKVPWVNSTITGCAGTGPCDVSIAVLEARTFVHRAVLVISTQGAGPATLTASVGRTGAAFEDYITDSDLKAAANSLYGDAFTEIGTSLKDSGGTALDDDVPSWTGTTTVNIQFNSVGANLSTVTGSTGYVELEVSVWP